MNLNRRNFVSLGGAAVGAGAGLAAMPGRTRARVSDPGRIAGGLDATGLGLRSGTGDDQGAALQSAIDDAVRRGMPLFIPPGRYLVSGVALPSGAYLVGTPGLTQLLFASGRSMFFGQGARNITLTGLTIAGAGNRFAGEAPGLVYLRGAADLRIEGCTVAGSVRSGIVLEYCSGHVADNDISGCADAGLFSLDAEGLEIGGNRIHDCGGNGVQIWRSRAGEDGTIVAQNRIYAIAEKGAAERDGNAVAIDRAGSVIVAGNRIAGCAASAVRADAAANCQIADNSCSRLGGVALSATQGAEGAVISNNIVDGAAAGIAVSGSELGGRLAVCTGNLVRNLSRDPESPGSTRRPGNEPRGVGIAVEADAIVANNLIENAEHAGIAIGRGPTLRDVSATGNVVRDAAIGVTVTVANGAGGALIADNVISKTPRGAILGMRGDDPATGDLALSGADKFPHLRVERNFVS